MSATLRALRELTEQARQAALDATDRHTAFFVYAGLVELHGDAAALVSAKRYRESARTAASRQAWTEIVQILERPEVKVIR